MTYFDMPMTDYTQLPDGSLYYSLVLLNSKDGEAEVTVAVLPPAVYSSGKACQLVDEWIMEPYSKSAQN